MYKDPARDGGLVSVQSQRDRPKLREVKAALKSAAGVAGYTRVYKTASPCNHYVESKALWIHIVADSNIYPKVNIATFATKKQTALWVHVADSNIS
eukprot:1016909-Prorocentrum_minimum.AAC.1